ncbi:MAG: OmpA family protein [Mariprofundaceae bacterium]|nr:OmpA family protein [Mariprofundaceae bacterium]
MKITVISIMVMFFLSACHTLNQEHYDSIVATPGEIKSLQQSNKKVQQDILSIKDSLSRMQHSMKQEINRLSVNISQPTSTSIQIVLQQQLLFDSGSSLISVSGRKALSKFATALEHAPASAKVRIVGHTDNQPVGATLKGTFTDNWELSADRAAAVARYLVWGEKISPNRLHIEGSAGTQAVADNATKEGRAKNRRIELFIEGS